MKPIGLILLPFLPVMVVLTVVGFVIRWPISWLMNGWGYAEMAEDYIFGRYDE